MDAIICLFISKELSMSLKLQTLIPLATTLFLVGCGGGGGDSSPSSNTNPTTPNL